MNTFRDENFISGYIGELVESGVVCPIGGFGWPQAVFDRLPVYPIQSHLPLTNSIRNNQIIVFHNDANLAIEYPNLTWEEPEGWLSGIIIPVYPIGGMAFVSRQRIEITHDNLTGLIAIGALLGLYASRLPTELIHEAIKVKTKFN